MELVAIEDALRGGAIDVGVIRVPSASERLQFEELGLLDLQLLVPRLRTGRSPSTSPI
jgi:hypothetical protein